MPTNIPNAPAGRDWAPIARDYAASALTVTEICALHAISCGALYRHITREGWPKRLPSRDGTYRAQPPHPEPNRAACAPNESAAQADALANGGQARSGGQPTASTMAPPKLNPPRPAPPAKAAPPRLRKKPLTARLLAALEEKMTEFETRRAAGPPASAADAERDARTLNTLVRLFDKLQSLGEKPARPVKTAMPVAPAGKDAHDADRLRHQLVLRLERLRVGVVG